MPTIHVTDLEGNVKAINANSGDSLMEALRDADYDEISAICGGCCACATCHVYIDDVRAPAKSDDEDFLLESLDDYKPETSRLSCQISLSDDMDGLQVSIAPAE